MNKMDIINKLASDINVNQKIAKIAVDTIIDSVKKAITSNERVEIRGFGSFKVKNCSSYQGRNPKTGEVIQVGEKNLPFFKVGKELKERVNKQGRDHPFKGQG